MINAIVSDFARVLLFPKDHTYQGTLNSLHKDLLITPNYSVLNHFELNLPLLDYYESLKDSLPLYMFTSDIIQDAPEFKKYLQPVFTKIFSASKMEKSKKDPTAYSMIATELDMNPSQILFIDDATENIQAAQIAGMQTILFTNNEKLITDVNLILKS